MGKKRYDWAWKPSGPYRGPYGSPTISRQRIYCSSPSGIVCCSAAETGVQIWSVNVKERFGGRGCDFGYAITPTIEDDKVIVPAGSADASIVALHVDDGRTVWVSGGDAASYCPILPITLQGRRLLVGYLQNALTIIDLETGKQLYHQSISTGYDEHSAWPLYREPDLLLLSPFRLAAKSLQLELKSNGTVQASQRWSNREFCNDVLSSVLHNNCVYGFDIRQMQASEHRSSHGTFKCVDWNTGAIQWSTNRIGHASIIVADNKLILLNDSGELILARADPTQYVELARTKLFHDEVCWTPPTLCHGRLLVRSPSRVLCLNIGRNDQKSELPTTSSVAPTRPLRWSPNPTWLIARERDYPNDAPSSREAWLWFVASLGLLLGSAISVELMKPFCLRCLAGPERATICFLSLAFALGLFGAKFFGQMMDECVFTWPLCPYVAFHSAVMASWRVERASERRSARRWARIAGLGLLAVAYGYFELCRSVGMFIGWAFLFGLLPAFPFTVQAVRSQFLAQRRLWPLVWTLVAFAVFYWSSIGLMSLKVVMDESV